MVCGLRALRAIDITSSWSTTATILEMPTWIEEMQHLAVQIGVPGEAEAQAFSQLLVEQRAVAGTRLSSGLSHYRWNDSVHEERYWTITGFTTTASLDKIAELVDEHHEDELPGITWQEIEAAKPYLDWIEEHTQ